MLRKLDRSFFDNNNHLYQALDCHDGVWNTNKTRGYGVIVIEFKSFTFAVPLRSNIKHKASYITIRSNEKGIRGMGLDFSKCLLIEEQRYISDQPFKISNNEHQKIKDKEHFIIKSFNKYIHAVKNRNSLILNSMEYRFTTLINYHPQLDIDN